jgi:hypothetical protein
LPSCTVTPLTLCTAWAASLSGLFEICSRVTEFTTPVDVRCLSSAELTEPRSTEAVTICVSNETVTGSREMSCSIVLPASRVIPVTVFGAKPKRRT